MADLSDSISVAAVAVAAAVALVAVYLGYRYQLKSLRSDRMMQAYSELMAAAAATLKIVVVLGTLAHAESKAKSWSAGVPPTAADVSSIFSTCDSARIQLGIFSGGEPIGSNIPGPDLADRAKAAIRFANETWKLAMRELLDKGESITRSSVAAYMVGADVGDRAAVQEFQTEVWRIATEAKGPEETMPLVNAIQALEERLRRSLQK